MRIVMLLVLACGLAQARPGGGHSFHSSSHSSSSFSHSSSSYHSSSHSYGYSSGGSFNVVGPLIVVLLLMFVAVILYGLLPHRHRYDTPAWDPSAYVPPASPPPISMDVFKLDDPDFSRPVFEDFAYRLYAEARRFGAGKLARYFDPAARAKLTPPAEQVVVGVLQILSAREDADCAQLVVHIEANLARGGHTQYVAERWTFCRSHGLTTKPPATHAWPCPNCGAPWDGNDPETCAHCGQRIEPGTFDWAVADIVVESAEEVGATLTGTVEEVGTDDPTMRQPGAVDTLAALTADDPGVTWPALEARAQMIYGRLNDAWNASRLDAVRGLVTRSLQDYLRYWLDEYRRQGLANHLDDARVSSIELAKVMRDRWFDAITVRIFADGLDYTVRGDKVVGGSRDSRRAYSEYWTFVRSSARRGPITGDPRCPNCGAPLQISDAGACAHCQAELENGSFDWVLSKIEQDEVYRG
jgi:hypothetical protein